MIVGVVRAKVLLGEGLSCSPFGFLRLPDLIDSKSWGGGVIGLLREGMMAVRVDVRVVHLET